jgi:hypothetical protein
MNMQLEGKRKSEMRRDEAAVKFQHYVTSGMG